MDNLYNFEEASKKLRISTQTLRKFVKNNQIRIDIIVIIML